MFVSKVAEVTSRKQIAFWEIKMAAPMDQNMFDAVKKILKENPFLHLDEKTNKVKFNIVL